MKIMKTINGDEESQEAFYWLIDKLNTGEERINVLKAMSKEITQLKQKVITK